MQNLEMPFDVWDESTQPMVVMASQISKSLPHKDDSPQEDVQRILNFQATVASLLFCWAPPRMSVKCAGKRQSGMNDKEADWMTCNILTEIQACTVCDDDKHLCVIFAQSCSESFIVTREQKTKIHPLRIFEAWLIEPCARCARIILEMSGGPHDHRFF